MEPHGRRSPGSAASAGRAGRTRPRDAPCRTLPTAAATCASASPGASRAAAREDVLGRALQCRAAGARRRTGACRRRSARAPPAQRASSCAGRRERREPLRAPCASATKTGRPGRVLGMEQVAGRDGVGRVRARRRRRRATPPAAPGSPDQYSGDAEVELHDRALRRAAPASRFIRSTVPSGQGANAWPTRASTRVDAGRTTACGFARASRRRTGARRARSAVASRVGPDAELERQRRRPLPCASAPARHACTGSVCRRDDADDDGDRDGRGRGGDGDDASEGRHGATVAARRRATRVVLRRCARGFRPSSSGRWSDASSSVARGRRIAIFGKVMATYRELLAAARDGDRRDHDAGGASAPRPRRRRRAALRRRPPARRVGRGSSSRRAPRAAEQPRVARRGAAPRQVAARSSSTAQSGIRSAFATKTLHDLGYDERRSTSPTASRAGSGTATSSSPRRRSRPRSASRYARHLLIPEVGEEGPAAACSTRASS